MNVNGRKTKEMLSGLINKDPPLKLTLDESGVERVDSFKLLGVHVSCDLKGHVMLMQFTPKRLPDCTS